MKTATLALLASALSSAQAAYNYQDNGANWATDSNKACKYGTRQSPIDLKSDMSAKEEEHLFKHYENLDYGSALPEVQAKHYGQQNFKKGEALYTTLDPYSLSEPTAKFPKSPLWWSNPNYFVSSQAADYFGEKNLSYYAKQMHFHTKSEHSIDGKLFDLELHIVHQALEESDAKFAELAAKENADKTVQDYPHPFGRIAVLGIIFDTENYDKDVSDETVAAIDKFFDSLDIRSIDKTTTYVDGTNDVSNYFTSSTVVVALGELLAQVDMGNRWVYSGSLTTPPCAENLYWNVVKTVYPIKKHHFAYYKNMIATLSD